jgi:hypothetical protein
MKSTQVADQLCSQPQNYLRESGGSMCQPNLSLHTETFGPGELGRYEGAII